MTLFDRVKNTVTGLGARIRDTFGDEEEEKKLTLRQRIERTTGPAMKLAKPIVTSAIQRELNKPVSPLFKTTRQDVINAYVDSGKALAKGADILLDYTLRPAVTRPVAKSIVSVADAVNLKPIAGQNKGQRITSLPVNDPAGRLLFGKEPLTSYQQDTRNAQSFLSDMGLPQPVSKYGGLGLGIGNAFLDLPVLGLAKAPVKEVAESAGKKALTRLAEEGAERIAVRGGEELAESVAKTEAKELTAEGARTLWGLMNSKHIAVKAGLVTEKQADKLNAAKTMKLIEDNIPNAIPDFNNPALRQKLKIAAQSAANTVKSVGGDFENAFRSWVNNRRSTELAGITAKQEFKELDKQGLKAIFEVQSAKPGFEAVRGYFDKIYKTLSDAGINVNYKKDYLPQLWNNTPEQVEKVFKTLNPSAPFTKESVLKNYKEGLAAGLSPRFNTVSDLVGWYEKTAQKTLADKQMLDFLKNKGLIKPASQAEKGWVRITAEGFPTERIKTVGGEYIDELYSAAPEIAERINNYLNSAQFKGLQKFADYNTAIKNVRLAAGIPGTGINAHGYNILVRSTLARNNPLGGFFDAGKWILNPNNADNFVKGSLDKALEYSKAGMTLTTEDFAFRPDPKIIDGNIAQRAYAILGNTIDKWMGDPLFRKVIPALKIKYADEVVNDLVKSGIAREDAVRQAAKVANNMFGGQNELDRIFKSKDAQNMFRAIILAPDWTESTLKVGGNIGKALIQPTNPMLKPYRTFARNFIALFIASQVMDKALSGEVGDLFTVNAGFTGDGQKRELRLFGTAADMFRIPFEAASNIAKGNFEGVARIISNRLSLGAGSILHFGINEDYRGRPIYGQDKYGNPIPAGQQLSNILSEGANALGVPSQVTTGIDFLSGRIGGEQALTQLTEVPFRYSGGAYSPASEKRMNTYKSAGLEGKDLYDAMNKKQAKPGILSWLFSGGQETSKVESNDPLIRAFNQEIDKDTKASRIREIFKDPALNGDRARIEKVLEAEGLGTFEEAGYTIAKSLGVENGVRGSYIKEILSPLQGAEYQEQFKKLVDNGVLTTGVIKAWEDNGDISEAQADAMRTLLKKSNGSYKPKKPNYSINIPGSLNLPEYKSTQIKLPPTPRINLEPMKIRRPTIKAPQMSSQQIPLQDYSNVLRYQGATSLGELGR